MANLNIPFLLLQPSTCKFKPTSETTKIFSFDQYNNPPRQILTGQQLHHQSRTLNQNNIIGGAMHNEEQTKFEFGKYSTFDDTPKSLVVSADQESGTIVLWHQDYYISKKKINSSDIQRVTRYLMSFVPRVALVSSITQETGPLHSYCLIKSPAPNILSTSTYLLVTIHRDGILRLWTTDDGRCILASQPELLSKPTQNNSYKIASLVDKSHKGQINSNSSLSGVIALTSSDSKEVLIINVYRMTILKRFQHGIDGNIASLPLKIIKDKIIITDQKRGKLHIWKKEEQQNNMSNGNLSGRSNAISIDSSSSTHSSFLLDITNTDDSQIAPQLNYKHYLEVGQDLSKILAFKFINSHDILLAKGRCIELYKDGKTTEVLTINRQNEVIFAKFINHDGIIERLLTIDIEFNMIIYDIIEDSKFEKIWSNNLMECTEIFDQYDVKTEGASHNSNLLFDFEEEKREKMKCIKEQMKSQINLGMNQIRFNHDQKQLYTILEMQLKKGGPIEKVLASWNLETLLENFSHNFDSKLFKLPLTMSSITLFPQGDSQMSESLLNFQPLLIKSFYNRHQFAFFFSDEKVTDSAIYTSSNHPSYLLGTTYGRIFMVSMFQETEDKVQPVLVIDSHHCSPITKMFIAYDSSRRGKNKQLLENGGHLISVSEDGTIAVTNLNSGEIHKAIHNYTTESSKDPNSNRADRHFEERTENRSNKRRNSIACDFSVNHFYNLVKVRSQKVYHYASFGNIDKILEVKNLTFLQEIFKVKERNGGIMNGKTVNTTNTPDNRPHEELQAIQNRMKKLASSQALMSGTTGSNDQSGFYACISSESGTIQILNITNLSVDLFQLSGLNTTSEILGIYQDANIHQIYVLTCPQEKTEVNAVPQPQKVTLPLIAQAQAGYKQQKRDPVQQLQFYIYNSKSRQLLRKVDQKYAMDVLMIRDTVDFLLSSNECFKQQNTQKSLLDYDNFHHLIKSTHDHGLLGLGSHKLLDYLTFSLNLPLDYHPHSPFSKKYTKTMRELIKYAKHFQIITGQVKVSQEEMDESQKIVLRAINDSWFFNNKIYQSDFNEEYFEKQSGITCLKTAQGTVFGSKQHILIANAKQMIQILQGKMNAQTKVVGKQPQRTTMQPSAQIQQPGLNQIRSNSPQASPPRNSPLSSSPQASPPNINLGLHDENNFEFEMKEEEKAHVPNVPTNPTRFLTQIQPVQSPSALDNEILVKTKWPTRILSLIHPFNVESNLDEMLERFMGLSLPFLDFRIGLQGAEESFSFVITREDEDFHQERSNPSKIIRMFRLSTFKKQLLEKLNLAHNSMQRAQSVKSSFQISHHQGMIVRTMQDVNLQFDNVIENEPSIRFFGSEQWKISGYLSTVIPSFFLSMLTAFVDYAKDDVIYMLQEWLFIVQKINHQRTISESCRLSLSAASKLLLKKDPCISSASRDVLLKPVLIYLAGTDRFSDVIEEWTALVLDTYNKIKKEPQVRQNYGQSSQQNQSNNTTNHSNPGASTQSSNKSSKKLINTYFGELEIRGLTCISYFALYNQEQLDDNLQYRVSKLTTLLTREIVDCFRNDSSYINLLTLLLQILSTWMKTQSNQSNFKPMIGQVTKLLLFIYNIYKSALNKENVIGRVNGDNFYLIKPTQPEVYLKLTAAKALLEIGENFTHDFLSMIHEEATTLAQGGEYQLNVLEILKIFMNTSCTNNANSSEGGGVNLENHLIQITQILLKCFDPNELALRKNSQRIVSLILSIMVKMFPMVAFHHESQRLAVGTHDGPIAIYDMRTCSKWKILEGHTGNITCLSFDSKGNLLASYSAVDRTLQLWKVGNTGFFSTIMGGTSKSSNKISLRLINNVRNPHARKMDESRPTLQQQEFNRNNSLFDQPEKQLNSNSQSGSSSKRVNCCTLKFIEPKEKEVELKREDGMRETHRLVK